MEPIEIGNLIQILPGNKIQVPHCEPPSSASSLRFSAYYAISNCSGGLVSVEAALAAIPGSKVIYGSNYGPPNWRAKWLRLPPLELNCSCDQIPDWYGILRDLPRIDENPDPGPCSLETSQWCNDAPVTEDPRTCPNTYFKEGEFPLGLGYLPLITPNQMD